jgi:ATP/maltotriose-dependent transcriptional regulator MalT
LQEREPTACQGQWGGAGEWRVWFQPVEHSEARMVSIAIPVPPGVLLLGPREFAVCQLMTAGLDICQIADALGLSASSVKAAKRRAAEVANVPLHDLPVWVGEVRRFLEPL